MKTFNEIKKNTLRNHAEHIDYYNEIWHLEETIVDIPKNSVNFQWDVENASENIMDFMLAVERVTEHIRGGHAVNLDHETSTIIHRINLLERHSKQYLKLEEPCGLKIDFDYEAYDSEGCLPFKPEFYAFLAGQFIDSVIAILNHHTEMRPITNGVLVFKVSAVDASNGTITSATLNMENIQLSFSPEYDRQHFLNWSIVKFWENLPYPGAGNLLKVFRSHYSDEQVLSGNMFKLLEGLTLKILEKAAQESSANAVVSLSYELELKIPDLQI